MKTKEEILEQTANDLGIVMSTLSINIALEAMEEYAQQRNLSKERMREILDFHLHENDFIKDGHIPDHVISTIVNELSVLEKEVQEDTETQLRASEQTLFGHPAYTHICDRCKKMFSDINSYIGLQIDIICPICKERPVVNDKPAKGETLMYQCPYERACKCTMKDGCGECETFGEFLNGNTIPAPPSAEMTEEMIENAALNYEKEYQRSLGVGALGAVYANEDFVNGVKWALSQQPKREVSLREELLDFIRWADTGTRIESAITWDSLVDEYLHNRLTGESK